MTIVAYSRAGSILGGHSGCYDYSCVYKQGGNVDYIRDVWEHASLGKILQFTHHLMQFEHEISCGDTSYSIATVYIHKI